MFQKAKFSISQTKLLDAIHEIIKLVEDEGQPTTEAHCIMALIKELSGKHYIDYTYVMEKVNKLFDVRK